MTLTSENYDLLLDLAQKSIIHGYYHHAPSLLKPTDYTNDLRQPSYTFVSIKTINNIFQGCQGNTSPMPLFLSVVSNAYKAAFADYRYPPLNNYRAKNSKIQIYHLYQCTEHADLTFEEIENLVDPDSSISLSHDKKQAIMLCTMQQHFGSKKRFLEEIYKKAEFQNIDYRSLKVKKYKTFVSKEKIIGDLNEISVIS